MCRAISCGSAMKILSRFTPKPALSSGSTSPDKISDFVDESEQTKTTLVGPQQEKMYCKMKSREGSNSL